MHTALQRHHVQSVIAQRRDDFLSPQFRWMVAVLTQAVRPLDQRNFAVLVDAFNRIAGLECSSEEIVAEAEASGRSYFASWLGVVVELCKEGSIKALVDLAGRLSTPIVDYKAIVTNLIEEFRKVTADGEGQIDLEEDATAWRELAGDIARNVGRNIGLDQFLQELQLRSKEPSPKPQTVTLMTVHAAKGREFDYVYLIGLAEDVLPSYQARQKGDQSPEMEEERRNCFVAITRAKECLVLSGTPAGRSTRTGDTRWAQSAIWERAFTT
jgi:DNA helicase II / ATP-dependent DNA helicase PcrA